MQETQLIDTKSQAILKGFLEFATTTQAVKISSKEDYYHCDKLFQTTKDHIKELEKIRKEKATPHYQNFTAINAKFKVVSSKLDGLKKVLNGPMVSWDNEQKRLLKIKNDKRIREAEEKARLEEEKAKAAREKAAAYSGAGNVKMAKKALLQADIAQEKAELHVPIVQEHVSAGKTKIKTDTVCVVDDLSLVLKHVLKPENKHLLASGVIKVDLVRAKTWYKSMKIKFDGISYTEVGKAQ